MVNDDDPTLTSPVNATFVAVVENELLVGEEVVEGITMRIRLEFHDAGDGRTRLDLRQGPYAPAVESGAREGWASSFTKLDALLTG